MLFAVLFKNLLNILRYECLSPGSKMLQIAHNLLFERKHVVVEEHVEFLVGVVDAELLERVGAEVLEAEYVEHAESAGGAARRRAAVDVPHQPRERARVQRAGHRVAVLASLHTSLLLCRSRQSYWSFFLWNLVQTNRRTA